ncbi:MAG: hypothetical protein J6U39_02890 [Clostridia bacterium]|nr:hypothetical protein [Clostridia bacterium]
MNITLAHRDNFYSAMLSGEVRDLYYACVDNLSRGILTTRMRVSDPARVNGDMRLLTEAILYGCPELFYVEQNIGIRSTGGGVELVFGDKYRGEDLRAMWLELNREIDQAAAWLNELSDPYEKVDLLNTYLCARVAPEASTEGRYGDPYGALVLGSARCEGYSKAAKMILDRVGIDSLIVCGEAMNEGQLITHSWNIVECGEGKYYHFDFSWNATRTHFSIPGQEYSFLDDATAFVEHFPWHHYPACSDSSHTFWERHHGVVTYHSDLSRADIVPFDNNYIAIVKLPEKLTEYELKDDVYTWMRDELAGGNFGSRFSYSYNSRLDLLIFYFINER